MAFHRLLFLVVIAAGCSKKESTTPDAARLLEALHAKDVQAVKSELQPLLSAYTETNLNQFERRLSSLYAVTTAPVCFDCIQTLPAQTEVRVSYTYASTQEVRFIDLSPDDSNHMRIVNVHE